MRIELLERTTTTNLSGLTAVGSFLEAHGYTSYHCKSLMDG